MVFSRAGYLPMNKVVHHQRRGRRSNRYPWGGGYYARFNTIEDAERAIRRGKRWLCNKSREPSDIPPAHIYHNAERAAKQFPELLKAA